MALSNHVFLIGADQHLRIGSHIIQCRRSHSKLTVIDISTSDDTRVLCEDLGVECWDLDGQPTTTEVVELINARIDPLPDLITLIWLVPAWSIRDLPELLSRVRRPSDLLMRFIRPDPEDHPDDGPIPFSSLEPVASMMTKDGFEALCQAGPTADHEQLPDHLTVRVTYVDAESNTYRRESVSKASDIAQMFYWMIASKHPLIVLGIPGLILFIVGHEMAGSALLQFDVLDRVSFGVALVVAGITFLGLFSMMSALILYVLGKQINRVQIGQPPVSD